MKIAIRVDSSMQIGSGHLMRCLTLAEQLRCWSGTEVHFISRDLPGNLSSLVRMANFFLHLLPRHATQAELSGYAAWLTVTQETDAAETISVLCDVGKIDWLVVDSYAIDITWEHCLRPYANHLLIIDDLANRRHQADIVLDQGLAPMRQQRYPKLVSASCHLLLGLKYLLLRDEFYAARQSLRERNGQIQRVLVFFGGADADNETSKVLQALEEFPTLDADIVIGGSNPHGESIKKYCQGQRKRHCHFQVCYMANLMVRADLAIGAAGSSVWERCFLQLPSLVVALATNQKNACEYLASQDLIFYLGDAPAVSSDDISKALRFFLANRTLYRRMQTAMEGIFAEHEPYAVAKRLLRSDLNDELI